MKVRVRSLTNFDHSMIISYCYSEIIPCWITQLFSAIKRTSPYNIQFDFTLLAIKFYISAMFVNNYVRVWPNLNINYWKYTFSDAHYILFNKFSFSPLKFIPNRIISAINELLTEIFTQNRGLRIRETIQSQQTQNRHHNSGNEQTGEWRENSANRPPFFIENSTSMSVSIHPRNIK